MLVSLCAVFSMIHMNLNFHKNTDKVIILKKSKSYHTCFFGHAIKSKSSKKIKGEKYVSKGPLELYAWLNKQPL